MGVSRAYFTQQKRNQGQVRSDTLIQFCDTFPDVNPEWLLTGNGSMFRNRSAASVVDTHTQLNKGIPLIPLDALMDTDTHAKTPIKNSDVEGKYLLPDFERIKPDYLTRIKGCAMSPKYNGGDVIAIKHVPIDDVIQWNKAYVLCSQTQGVLVKRIRTSPREGYWLLVSDDTQYEPFEIPINKVHNIFLIVGSLHME